MKNWRVELKAEGNFSKGENPKRRHPERRAFTLIIWNSNDTTQSLATGTTNLRNRKNRIISLCKCLQNLMQTIIYSHDIGIEFGIEIIRSGKTNSKRNRGAK